MAHYVLDTNQPPRDARATARVAPAARAAPISAIDVEARQQIAMLARQLGDVLKNQAKMADAINGTDGELKAFAAEVAKAFKQVQAMIAQITSGPAEASIPPSDEVVDVNGARVEDAFAAPDDDGGPP